MEEKKDSHGYTLSFYQEIVVSKQNKVNEIKTNLKNKTASEDIIENLNIDLQEAQQNLKFWKKKVSSFQPTKIKN